MGRGRSMDPARLQVLEQQAEHFQIQPTLPEEHWPERAEQLQLTLYLDQQPRMDQLEAQLEQHLGKLLHQERITFRTLLMGRLRRWTEQTCHARNVQ